MKTLLTMTACLAILTVWGCAGHSHKLTSVNSSDFNVGWLKHWGAEEPLIVLELGGKRFEARGFAIKQAQDLEELRRQYGSGKHYDRIISKTDKDHIVYSAEPELRAPDGAVIRCSIVWGAPGNPAGTCMTTEGKQINIYSE